MLVKCARRRAGSIRHSRNAVQPGIVDTELMSFITAGGPILDSYYANMPVPRAWHRRRHRFRRALSRRSGVELGHRSDVGDRRRPSTSVRPRLRLRAGRLTEWTSRKPKERCVPGRGAVLAGRACDATGCRGAVRPLVVRRVTAAPRPMPRTGARASGRRVPLRGGWAGSRGRSTRRARRTGMATAHLQRRAIALQRGGRRLRSGDRHGGAHHHRVGHTRSSRSASCPRCCEQTTCGASLFSEPGRLRPRGLRTRAERDGDEWTVKGQKVWTSGAHYSDWGLLLARSDPGAEAQAHHGVPPRHAHAGNRRAPLRQITGASHFNEVFLTDAHSRLDARWSAGRRVAGCEHDALERARADRQRRAGRLPGSGLTREALWWKRRSDSASGACPQLHAVAAHQVARLAGAQPQGPGPRPRGLGIEARGIAPARAHETRDDLQGAASMLYDDDAIQDGHWQQQLGQWSSRLGGGTEQIQRTHRRAGARATESRAGQGHALPRAPSGRSRSGTARLR